MEENDKKNMIIKSLNTKSNYVLILTEDCFLLLEKVDNWNGKIVFWSSLFSITNLQLNKSKKVTTINFYDDDNKCFIFRLIFCCWLYFIMFLSEFFVMICAVVHMDRRFL